MARASAERSRLVMTPRGESVAPRIPLLTDQLTPLGVPDAADLCPTLAPVRGEYYKAIVTTKSNDPITTELVRLRNAEFQSCYL